ncbi:MAG: ABC-2 transporter permease [Lachnospiraceae bacterium]|nr:ABC-2 transporter permease [Lachnospiraceae bacterium]
MAGLLYKDFVGIKGKRIIWTLIGCTVLLIIVRLAFPGNVAAATETGDVRDSFVVMLTLLFIAFGFVLPSGWTAAICKNDEKYKTRQFTRVLPLDKNAYIASKYIFIGIAVYVLYSMETMWIIIFNSVAGDNASRELISAFSQFLPVFCGISLLLASIELPFFIMLGVKKGSVVKIALLEGGAFLAIVYLFFGNLKVFENFDINVFVSWCQEHMVVVTLYSILSPVLNLVVFLLSYRITCRVSKNREVEIDG